MSKSRAEGPDGSKAGSRLREAALLAAVAILGLVVASWLDDALAEWETRYDGLYLDEILLTTLAVLAVYSWRRHRETRAEAVRRDRAERALADVNERSQSLVRYHPHAVFSLDVEGRFVEVNPACERLTGYSEADLRGMESTSLSAPDDSEMARATLEDLANRRAREFRTTVLNRDGDRVDLRVTSVPIVVRDAVVGMYGIAEDVTAAHQMQRDLEHARESAELANAAKSMFLANMSHELRTPLTSVVAASEMLAGTDLTRQQERLLDSVVRSGRRLRLLVEDILTFSRIEAGKVDVDAVEFDLKPVLVEVVEFAREQAARKGLDFAWAFHPDVPSTMVGDSTKLFQVLSNLLDNAIKFTESGSVRMSVAHAAAGDAGERVTFTVTDTGIGMDPDQVEQLFQPFSQADPSTTRKYGGAGLGLAICKELVGLMDGTIRVESVEGSGSRFAVVLPRRAPPDREPTAQRSPDVNGAGVVAVE